MASTRRSKVKQPQQITVLGRDLAVLRKINMKFPGSPQRERDNIVEMLALTQLEPGVFESEMSWFAEGYVTNDHPRDMVITQKIMGATLGFAVARTDTGEILREYGKDGLKKAEAAIADAKPRLELEVALDDDEDEAAPEPEADAAPAPADTEDEDEA